MGPPPLEGYGASKEKLIFSLFSKEYLLFWTLGTDLELALFEQIRKKGKDIASSTLRTRRQR